MPTQCIYVFCVDLRTNSDYFPTQQWLTGFYNRDGECLLRGTDFMCQIAVITICTTSLTFNNSTLCPHSVFMCFVWISEQTAIISLYSINWLVFITEMESVYCAVRTESLNTIQVILMFRHKCNVPLKMGTLISARQPLAEAKLPMYKAASSSTINHATSRCLIALWFCTQDTTSSSVWFQHVSETRTVTVRYEVKNWTSNPVDMGRYGW